MRGREKEREREKEKERVLYSGFSCHLKGIKCFVPSSLKKGNKIHLLEPLFTIYACTYIHKTTKGESIKRIYVCIVKPES